ncbi:MAG: hypothetical protein ACRDYA_04855 [Egibacteraceae bacterium]
MTVGLDAPVITTAAAVRRAAFAAVTMNFAFDDPGQTCVLRRCQIEHEAQSLAALVSFVGRASAVVARRAGHLTVLAFVQVDREVSLG